MQIESDLTPNSIFMLPCEGLNHGHNNSGKEGGGWVAVGVRLHLRNP